MSTTLKGYSHLPAVQVIHTFTRIYSIHDVTFSKDRKCDCCKTLIDKGTIAQRVQGRKHNTRRQWFFCDDCKIPESVVRDVFIFDNRRKV